MPAPAPLPPCPAALLDPGGAPVVGAFAGRHVAVDLRTLVSPGLAGRLRHLARAKAWCWVMVVTDEVLAAAAIVEAGWFAGGFAWGLDRTRGEVLFEASAAGLPGMAHVAPRAGGAARLRSRALSAELSPEGAALALRVRGPGVALEAVLDGATAPAPFTLVAPVPGAGLRATTKAAALAARGTLSVGDRTWTLADGAGGLDFTSGVLARETAWRWAFATGRTAGGARFGMNLCEGFGVAPDAPGENAGFLGVPYRLPPVVFQVGGRAGHWAVRDPAGAVDLVFRPEGAHGEARNLGLVSTRFIQVAGVFEGRVPGPDGAPVAVHRVPGVVEDHQARW